MAKNNKRFFIWRRHPEDLQVNPGNLGTLQDKLSEAGRIINTENKECVLVLEVVKVVRKCKAPFYVEDF